MDTTKIRLLPLISQVLCEKRTKDVIVCDVQPMYQKWVDFDIETFGKFLEQSRRILYFYNGIETVGSDTKEDIIEMFHDSNASDILLEKLHNDVLWIDKGYGFFRNWMDSGASNGFIQKAVRFMVVNRINDSRDIDPEIWKTEFPDDFDDTHFEYDNIFIPDISLNQLKSWSGAYLTGGGRNECLLEVQLLMNAFNIKYTLVQDFIYG